LKKGPRSNLLIEYMRQVEPTDKLPPNDLQPILLGLFGEVGSIMATAKKLHREKNAYAGFRHAVAEEFGDALWYLTALCRRLNIGLDEIFLDTIAEAEAVSEANYMRERPVDLVTTSPMTLELDSTLLKLGQAAAKLLSLKRSTSNAKEILRSFADWYLKGLKAAGMPFAQVAEYNIAKTRGRFLEPDDAKPPTFDDAFEAEERIPAHFEITISQRKSGKSYMQWHGVFIGDPLTDNICDEDGYRFHDVFHFAHASILHWSPTFRALIKHKRKSNPIIDETQDGGRAIVVEEGLTAWIFSRAKQLGFFESQSSVSFDMLKTVQQFVRGYEVEECPLKLWEHAILQGYEVFRRVRANNGGTIIGDRETRTVSYKTVTLESES
jgi:NTP pyrophosphatase (non-canonical NTP hydrolase)